ncbi:hypothetical protein C8A05DRAFT_46376 [Staphylotrichum tortipilum]|uniref:Rhodopsin domain-containing protein n=1 Tax=Staphylotrichum tortipilum TaxID=2831512 RepID=A0AAN6MEY7_9PEZI|nr:hypothetical protein C8A05DRAFT_46376 [Staphylotrichum longicolle]
MADPSADLSRGPVLLSFSLATASFALATTFVRFYVRRGIHGGFGADDYTSGAATVIALIGTIFGILESSQSDSARALQFHVIGQPWYLVSATLSKASICLFFMNLLRRARQWRILLAGLITVMAVINAAFALTTYLQCRPLARVWDPSVAGSCSDPSIQVNFGYAQGAFSVFSWVFLALFPMLILRDIARGGEPTWPFYATAALSFVAGIFVIVRTAQTSQTTASTIYTIHFFYASLMANLEQNLSLTTTNLLTLGPLFTPSPTTTTSSTTTSTTPSTRRGRPRPRRDPRRRDPYASASSSSAGTSRSRKRTLTGGTGTLPSRAGSSRSLGGTDTRGSSRVSLTREEDDGREGGNKTPEGDGKRGRDLERGVGSGSESDDGEEYFSGGESDLEDGEGYGSEDIDLGAWPRGIIKTVSVEVVEEVNEEYVAALAAAAAKGGSPSGGNGNGAAEGGKAVQGNSIKGVGRNSVVIVPGAGGAAVRMPRAPPAGIAGETIPERVSGASGIEQDWEAMLRAGPPR